MCDAPFRCACGAVKGVLHHATSDGGNHVVCFCDSCRAGALYCGENDPAPEGLALFQTTPDNITFSQGQDLIAPFAFVPRNLLRWKATCCGSFLFSTPRNPKLALVGLYINRPEDPSVIGPVKSRAFVPQPGGKKAKHENLPALLRVFGRILAARISGRWRNTALFDPQSGQPIAPVVLVSKKDKKALLAAQS